VVIIIKNLRLGTTKKQWTPNGYSLGEPSCCWEPSFFGGGPNQKFATGTVFGVQTPPRELRARVLPSAKNSVEMNPTQPGSLNGRRVPRAGVSNLRIWTPSGRKMSNGNPEFSGNRFGYTVYLTKGRDVKQATSAGLDNRTCCNGLLFGDTHGHRIWNLCSLVSRIRRDRPEELAG
jgi:hypothetical protein